MATVTERDTRGDDVVLTRDLFAHRLSGRVLLVALQLVCEMLKQFIIVIIQDS